MKFLVIFSLSLFLLTIGACSHIPLPAKPDSKQAAVTLAKPVALTTDAVLKKNIILSQNSSRLARSVPLQATSKQFTHIQTVGQETENAIELSLQINPKISQLKSATSKELIRSGIQLLENGNITAAENKFKRVLQREQKNQTALFMLRQIQLTPKQYFDPNSFSSRYQVRDGDTLASIADKILGDRLSFHSLVKLNKRKNIHDLKSGDIVFVPIAQLAKINIEPVVKVIKIPRSAPQSKSLSRPKEMQAASTVSNVATRRSPAKLEAALVQLKTERIYRSGMNDLRNGKQYEAFKAFEKILILQPSNNMAATQLKKLKPTVTQYLYDKAMVLYKNQKIKAAIGNWDRVLMIDSEHELAKVYRGRAIELQERLDKLPKNL